MDRAMPVTLTTPRGGTRATLVVAVVFACAGCTICPDPFDYSGPVPDGSPPQNDFRARSGGILPLSAAPKPWPPIVKDGSLPDVGPVMADADSEWVEEADTIPLQQTSVLVSKGDESPAVAEADAGQHPEARPEVIVDETTAPLQPVPSASGPNDSVPAGGDSLPSAADQPPLPTAGKPAETPGWRPRRRSAG